MKMNEKFILKKEKKHAMRSTLIFTRNGLQSRPLCVSLQHTIKSSTINILRHVSNQCCLKGRYGYIK